MPLHFLLSGAAGALTSAGSLAATVAGDVIALTGDEAHHAAVVRRVRVGEEVTVGDGAGTVASGVVDAASPREVVVRVTALTETARPTPALTLVQALAKGDRDELAVQAATELGVDRIVPWQAARSVSRWDAAKAAKGVARWAAIAREAGKQAHRAWLPEVAEPVTTPQLAKAGGRMLVLEPSASVALTGVDWASLGDDIVLVVGPEGGIAPDELETLAAAGATLVRLGETVLRTSTAGPAALAVASAALGRW